MLRLIACTTCRRHLAASEPACPFCGAAPPALRPPTPDPVGRLCRAAVFAGGILASTALPACSASHAPHVVHSTPGTGPARVVGVVTDSETGHGAASRFVVLHSEALRTTKGTDTITTMTETSGEFVFENLPPGHYAIDMENAQGTWFDVVQGEHVRVDLTVVPPPPRRHQEARPYGAPPARRRIV